ncbi:vWA-like protein [Purpureocillium lilacinum]|uniref:VWA-like protein n=1 Tax=Purpureocillium lilacinum TaxID=33203 RepID=A0A179G9C7_PURLI|nr:vWA-like protein [Purpureocillium lilacinum]OAQ74414.1 vWA-like protein [Purpureocillium lilacinum]
MAEAALRMFPGILFRPREPVPPRFAHLVPHLEDNVGGFDRRELNRDPSRGLGVGRDGPGITNFARVGPDPWGARIPRSPVPRPSPDDWAEPHNTRFALLPERPPQQHQGFLPPLSSSVKVQIVHDTAKFTVTHVFWNRSEAIKQGTYQFPLPLDATVTEFNCRIGTNRIIRGKVKGKEEARRDFDDDVRRGRTGGMVEQETAEIFTINLANIDANTKMRAELSFMCFLKHRTSNNRDVFTLTVPTFIAPRFGDVPQGVLVEYQFSHFLSFEADVLTTEELITVNSDTHNIRFVRGAGRRACQTWDDFVMQRDNVELNQKMGTVELEDARASLDKDMVITITTAQSDNNETPHACIEAHPHLENHKSLMLTLPSDYLLSGEGFAHDGEIVFVADRSGSMTGKIESLKSAMLFFIHGIPENRPFNIWCFGSRCEYMWPRSKNLTEQTRLEAIHYVQRNFAVDMGGTDILPALKRIYEPRGGYHTLDVVVLTDGAIWGPHEIIEYVKEKRLVSEGLFRCFSLGIGYAVSHELVEGLAKAGGGYAEVITNVCGGGWEDRVVAVLKSALAGHVGSVEMRLEWRKEDSQELVQSPMSFKQSPANISAISPFIRNRIFLLFDSDVQTAELTSVNLKIRAPGGHVTTKRVLPKRLLEPDSTLHKLAVRALLGDLERGESWLHCCQDGAEDAAVRQEAIDLGMKWSLVSKWKSLYAVEEETDEPFDINIQFHLDEEEATHEDALLQPRGTVNQNIGLTKGGAANKALDTATESDPSSDSEDDNNVESKHDDGSDGGSDDGDGNDNEPNVGADLAGQHGRSGAGSADGVHYGRHDEIPDDICDYGDSRMDNVDDATSDHTGAANEPEFESASLTSRSEIRRRSGHQELAAAELGRTTVSGLVEHHRGRVGDARFAPATSQTSWSRNRSSSRTRGVEVVGAVLTTYMRDDLQDAAAAAKIPDGVVKWLSPLHIASAAAEHSLDEWESTASKEKPPLDRSSTYPWIIQPVASSSTKPVYQDHHVGS